MAAKSRDGRKQGNANVRRRVPKIAREAKTETNRGASGLSHSLAPVPDHGVTHFRLGRHILRIHPVMNFKSVAFSCLFSASAALASASTHVGIGLSIGMPAPIIVREAPPRPVHEVIIASPGPGNIWVPGHYSWSNSQWAWVAGTWIVPPQPGAYWVEGRWDSQTQSWTEGHWEIAQSANGQPTSPPPTPPPTIVVPASPAPTLTQIVVATPPPPVRIERHGRRPGRDFVWVNGYWAYRGHQHVWVAGHWDRPPHGHRVWIEPRWEHRGGTYVFIEGRWQ